MKAFRFISMALVAVLMCVNFTSCSNEEIAPKEEGKYVTVDLGVTGEYLEVSEMPLATRTSGTDTYGINVYIITDGGSEQLYASGLFASLTDVKIKLLKGEKYKFETGIYINDMVALDAGEYISVNRHGKINEDFVYGANGWVDNFIGMPGTKEHDYFYGVLSNYSPTENGTVEIYTKRTVYGAHYIAEGLVEGSLQIHVQGTDGSYNVNLTETMSEHNGIYCFSSIYQAWFGCMEPDENGNPAPVNYYASKKLTVTWTKDDGSVVPLGTFDITFKRNVKTTIVIKVADPSQQNGIVVTKEETRMTDDENKYVIEGGTITEVPVTSQQ